MELNAFKKLNPRHFYSTYQRMTAAVSYKRPQKRHRSLSWQLGTKFSNNQPQKIAYVRKESFQYTLCLTIGYWGRCRSWAEFVLGPFIRDRRSHQSIKSYSPPSKKGRIPSCFHKRKCGIWAYTILLCLMLCACATIEKEFPCPEQTFQWDQETPKGILDRLQKEQARIISLTASFSILMDPPPQGQSSHLRGVIFFQKSDEGPQVRIKGLAPFGGTLFDMVARGDAVEIYIPSRNTLYKGRREQKRPGNIWADTLQNMFPDFSRVRVKENAVLEFKRHAVILPLSEGEIHLHMESGRVFKWISGERITLYDNYENQQGLPPIPARISIERMDSPTKAIIRLDQITLNDDFGDVFDLSIYKARSVRNLSELKGP